MEHYDKIVDRFQDLPKVQNHAVVRQRSNKVLRAFKRKCFGEYDAVILIMLNLKVLVMVSQNS